MVAVKTRSTGGKAKTIPLEKIRLDGDTQSRKDLDEDVIKEYAGLIEDGVEFPPLDVVFDGANYWLVDGFHRRWAAVKAKVKTFKCKVVQGTREDARWLSYAANRDHGLMRKNEDKKKAVIGALKHPKGANKADSKIAEHVGVDHKTVAKYRAELESSWEIPKIDSRTVTRGGTTYEQNTANIGQTQKAEALARAAANGTKSGAVASSGAVANPPTPAAAPVLSDDPIGDACTHEADEDGDCKKCGCPMGPNWKALLQTIVECRRAADTTNVACGRKGQFNSQFQDTCGILDDIVRDWRKVAK